MRRGPIPYSDMEMSWLETNRMMVISDYQLNFRPHFLATMSPRHI